MGRVLPQSLNGRKNRRGIIAPPESPFPGGAGDENSGQK